MFGGCNHLQTCRPGGQTVWELLWSSACSEVWSETCPDRELYRLPSELSSEAHLSMHMSQEL